MHSASVPLTDSCVESLLFRAWWSILHELAGSLTWCTSPKSVET